MMKTRRARVPASRPCGRTRCLRVFANALVPSIVSSRPRADRGPRQAPHLRLLGWFSPRGGTCCPSCDAAHRLARPSYPSINWWSTAITFTFSPASREYLYIGVTNNLGARILQHRSGDISGFTSDYKVHRLVYYEQHAWIPNAIAREKQLKRWRREKKVWLIERENPTWEDLAADWGKPVKLIKRNPANAEDSRSLHAG